MHRRPSFFLAKTVLRTRPLCFDGKTLGCHQAIPRQIGHFNGIIEIRTYSRPCRCPAHPSPSRNPSSRPSRSSSTWSGRDKKNQCPFCEVKSCADLWAFGIDIWHRFQGFNKSLTPTQVAGFNDLSKPWFRFQEPKNQHRI